jgi:hypothetical protein
MSLDMYLENSEIGGRSVHYLLGSIFDTSGVFIGSGLFDWKGTWQTSTTYAVGDTFIDPATDNIYVTLVAHTSSSVASDLAAAKTAIALDVTQVKADKNAAAASATAAQSSEDDAASDLLLTNADVVLTHADVVLTAADVVLAEAAKTAAETAQSLAETAYENVDDLYLGSKTSDPTLNNDGDALIDGTLYYNTTSNQLKTQDATSHRNRMRMRGSSRWNSQVAASERCYQFAFSSPQSDKRRCAMSFLIPGFNVTCWNFHTSNELKTLGDTLQRNKMRMRCSSRWNSQVAASKR